VGTGMDEIESDEFQPQKRKYHTGFPYGKSRLVAHRFVTFPSFHLLIIF